MLRLLFLLPYAVFGATITLTDAEGEKEMKAQEIQEVTLTDKWITLDEFMAVVRYGAVIKAGDPFMDDVRQGRALIDRFLSENKAVYGVTTGFGENVRFTISPDDALELQKRIVRSHSVAVGEPLPEEHVRAIMLQMILNARRGRTGLREETLQALMDFLNKDIYPFVPGEGSVGYLSVEGHIVMALIGEGYVFDDNGEQVPAADVLKETGIEPVELACKEGLSLLNGTISVTALAAIALFDAKINMKNIEICGALAYEALRGTVYALDDRIMKAKNHPEAVSAAKALRDMLAGSAIAEHNKDRKVQDAYVLRAMPQLIGASMRLVKEAEGVIMEEINGTSDNPELFIDEGEVRMCGNFDGSYVGSHADMLGMSAAIIGNFIHSSINRTVDRNLNDGLPAFLVADPGLNNGFMIPQYTAAGLEHEIRQLAQPSTNDSITTCASQEDPVSFGYDAAKNAIAAQDKLAQMTAISYLTSLQAIDLLKVMGDPADGGKPVQEQSPVLAAVYDYVRESIPYVDQDRYIYPDIELMTDFVEEGSVVDLVEEKGIEL